MFTLCMSRGHPPLQDSLQHNNINKQVKGGYLLRYRRGFFCKGWCEEWVVLYEDSTIAWYADKGLSRPRGRIRISDAPELLAIGEWTRQVPRRPRFPRTCHVGQLLAIGTRTPHDVHWLMAQSPAEVNDWMTAISNTLPPPPHLPLEDNLPSNTPLRDAAALLPLPPARNCTCSHVSLRICTCGKEAPVPVAPSSVAAAAKVRRNKQAAGADYTVLSGLAIDWGHGWGWGQSALAAQTACAHDSIVTSSIYCHAADDYAALGGCDEVDWSAFGDFSF